VSKHYATIAFTPPVLDVQEEHGSRDFYERKAARGAADPGMDALTATEREFLEATDGFYLATTSETGWPYIQHRGGPIGFVKVLDQHTIGWADFRGNLQYISTGNLAGDDRVALFVMDYVHQRRLKIFGRARVATIDAEPDLARQLVTDDDGSVVERVVVVTVEAFDWNCPQHITQRFTLAELEAGMAASHRS
jgi:predicted pyridoxine 5'-phosphate oxidase superfamily flavin-nucleotide-binding protein